MAYLYCRKCKLEILNEIELVINERFKYLLNELFEKFT